MTDRDDAATQRRDEGNEREPAAGPGTAQEPDVGPDAPATPGAGAAIGTEELLVSLLGVLAAKAWEGMGLVAGMGTGTVAKDIGSARLAIDAYSAIFDLIRGTLPDAQRRDMETLLMNLRVNFVDKSAG